MTFAEVILWGTKIGTVALPDDSPIATFRYDRDFLNSGIEVSPITMPLSPRQYSFAGLSKRTFHGLPGWNLSPAYDLTLSYSPSNIWLKAHQMSVNGKRTDITKQDIISCASAMDISEAKCKIMTQKVEDVVSHFSEFAEEADLPKSETDTILKTILKGN